MSSRRPAPVVVALLPAVAFLGSAAVTVLGALTTSSASETLNAALVSGTGTAADVYGSQSAIVVSSGLLTAGIVGLVVSIALFGALIAFGAFAAPAAEPELDEFDDEDDEVELDAVDEVGAAERDVAASVEQADASAEPVADEASEPAVEAEPARA